MVKLKYCNVIRLYINSYVLINPISHDQRNNYDLCAVFSTVVMDAIIGANRLHPQSGDRFCDFTEQGTILFYIVTFLRIKGQ